MAAESRVTLMPPPQVVDDMANPNPNQEYHDESVLQELYHERGMTQSEIADKFDTSQHSISRAMKRYDVDTRGHTDHFAHVSRDYAGFHTGSNGYERSYSQEDVVSIHRLAAVAWFGLYAVVDNHVHHKSNVPWDNRENNLEPLSPGDHNRLHKSAKDE